MEARARNYTIIEGNLYKKGVVQPLQKTYLKMKARNSYAKYTKGCMAPT